MLDTKITQTEPKILLQQQNHQKNKETHGDIRQDKRAFFSARIATPQPARRDIPMRARTLTTKKPRSQNPSVPKKSAGKTQGYRKPIAEADS
jgi:hypothetical protein